MNPIKTSDIYEDDGAIKKLIAELHEVGDTLDKLRGNEVANASKLEAATKRLTGATAAQREQIEGSAKQAEEIEKRYKKYNESLSKNAIELAAIKNAQRQLNKVNKLETAILSTKEGSYDNLSAQYSLNKIKLNQMTEAERLNTKAGQDLEKQTNAIYQAMKASQERTGKHSLSVGDYTKTIREASKEQSRITKEIEATTAALEAGKDSFSPEEIAAHEAMIANLTDEYNNLGKVTGKTINENGSFIDALENTEGALGGAVGGVKKFKVALKGLLANPVVLILAALAAVLVTLFSAFGKSAKGAKMMAKASALMEGVMSQLVNVSVKVAEVLEWAFDNPKEALEIFGDTLKKNLMNRLEAVIDLVGVFGDALTALWQRDLEGLKKAANDSGTALIKMQTGLDAEDQKLLGKEIAKATDEIIKETAAFVKLADQKLRVQKANRALTRSIEELTTSEETNQMIADDATRSFKEREEAAKAARIATEKRAKKEIQLAKNNLSIINAEIDLRRNNGEEIEALLDSQLSAYSEVISAERGLSLARMDNEKVLSELKQDRLEKDLDILIDGFDNQKSINERLLQDERTTLEERKKIFDDTVSLSNESFSKQVQTIQQFTGIAIDENDLLNESNAVVLNQKIRSLGLSEIIEGRLLEVIRDRRTAIQDLNEAEIELAEKQRTEQKETFDIKQKIAASDFQLTQKTEIEKAEFALSQKRELLKELQRLNSESNDKLPPINTEELEASIRKMSFDMNVIRKESALDAFDIQQELEQSQFDLLEKTELEKTKFSLNAEKERLAKILELNEIHGSELSDKQIEIIQNQISKINNEIASSTDSNKNIFEVFGFDLNEKEIDLVNKTYEGIKSIINDIADMRINAANAAVAASEKQIAASQRALDIEIQNRNAGFAHNIETAARALDQDKKNQRKALKEQQKAQKQKNAIQTIEQGVNLVTAVTQIWSSFSSMGPAGPFLAAAATAAMFGAFVAGRVKAAKLTKQKFGDGGLEIIGGGSHASGNDTPLGFQVNGKEAYAEKGEAHAIIPATKTKKYKSILPTLVDSLRKGTFERQFEQINGNAKTDSSVIIVGGSGDSQQNDITSMESDISEIRKQGEKQYISTNEGLVMKYKNLTRTYVN